MKLDSPIVALGEILWDLLPTGRRAGGAPFNFAFHCQQLGHPAVIVSRVGDDDLGRDLRDAVRGLGLSDAFVQSDPAHPTGTVGVAVDEAGQPQFTIHTDVAYDHLAWTADLEALFARAARLVKGATATFRARPLAVPAFAGHVVLCGVITVLTLAHSLEGDLVSPTSGLIFRIAPLLLTHLLVSSFTAPPRRLPPPM